MAYPSICRYKESLISPAGLFKTLQNIEACSNSCDELKFSSGSNSVVFSVRVDSKPYALKCFTKDSNDRAERYDKIEERLTRVHSQYFIECRYLHDEIYVFDHNDIGAYYPVLLMEEIEGETLGNRLYRLCYNRDIDSLRNLAREFDKMAVWLLENDFAHGDIKPENIIVINDGSLKLIDYDAMYVPSMNARQSCELGTIGFQHPLRNIDMFDSHMDDYSIAVLSITIHTLVLKPELFKSDYYALFDPIKLISDECLLLREMKNHWLTQGESALYNLATMLGSCTPVLDDILSVLLLINNRPFPIDHSEYLDSREGMTIITKDGMFGFYNCDTGETIDIIYDDVKPFSCGVAPVRVLKRWFYINKRGVKVLDASRFDYVDNFKDGFAVVGKSGKYGFIDSNGNISIPLLYDFASNFNEGFAVVKINERYGFINTFGKFVVKPIFGALSSFKNGLAKAQIASVSYNLKQTNNSIYLKVSKYTARITRKTPSLFIFLIDISGSMEDNVPFDGQIMTKASAVAILINKSIDELLNRCKREEGYRPYFDIGVIGYGGDTVQSMLEDGASNKFLWKPSELSAVKTSITKIFKERTLSDGKTQTTVTEIKDWVKPIALGKTPMFAAFVTAYKLVEKWIEEHSNLNCFPPVVINITDGEATDAHKNELINMANKIKSLTTQDGNTLLMNLYLSSDSSGIDGIMFPSAIEQLPKKPYAGLLFEMSSEMPEIYHGDIMEIVDSKDVKGCRGMSYNSSMNDVMSMLNIGSVSVSQID